MEVDITTRNQAVEKTRLLFNLDAVKWLSFVLSILYGLFVFHGILLKDGLDYVHGDFGDSRLVALFLENSYQYFSTLGAKTSFWSPTWIYFPFKNGMAFADNLSGALWLYAPWRMMGFSEMTSYQLWFVGLSLANCAAFILLGRELKFSLLGLCAGAYLVGFGMPNLAFSNHPQLLSNFYISLTLLSGYRSLKATAVPASLKNALLAGVFYALQCWTGFYQFWFFSFSSIFLFLVLIPSTWPAFKSQFKIHVYRGLVFGGIAGLMIFPIVRRYLIVKGFAGERLWSEVDMYLPTWRALLLPPSSSKFYHGLFEKFSVGFPFIGEMCMFAGYLALSAPLLFFLNRTLKPRKLGCEKFIQAVAIIIPVLLFLTLKWPESSYWMTIYHYVPGATAVRAVGRISLLVLLYTSIVLGYVATTLEKRKTLWSTTLAFLIITLLVIENSASHTYAFRKSEHARRIEPYVKELENQKNCRAFHIASLGEFDPLTEVDAMWTSMVTSIPTSNGYSGVMPPKYAELEIFKAVTVEKLQDWFSLNSRNVPKENICLLP